MLRRERRASRPAVQKQPLTMANVATRPDTPDLWEVNTAWTVTELTFHQKLTAGCRVEPFRAKQLELRALTPEQRAERLDEIRELRASLGALEPTEQGRQRERQYLDARRRANVLRRTQQPSATVADAAGVRTSERERSAPPSRRTTKRTTRGSPSSSDDDLPLPTNARVLADALGISDPIWALRALESRLTHDLEVERLRAIARGPDVTHISSPLLAEVQRLVELAA